MFKFDELGIQYVTDSSGEKRTVILSFEQFRQLVEDLLDLVIIAERVNEPTISPATD